MANKPNEVSFNALVYNKQVMPDPVEGECVRLDLFQLMQRPPVMLERSMPSEAREVGVIVEQLVRSMPFGMEQVRVPRLTVWLTKSEWDQLEPKPDLWDEVTVRVSGGRFS